MGCNYLSLPEIPVSGNKVHIYSWLLLSDHIPAILKFNIFTVWEIWLPQISEGTFSPEGTTKGKVALKNKIKDTIMTKLCDDRDLRCISSAKSSGSYCNLWCIDTGRVVHLISYCCLHNTRRQIRLFSDNTTYKQHQIHTDLFYMKMHEWVQHRSDQILLGILCVFLTHMALVKKDIIRLCNGLPLVRRKLLPKPMRTYQAHTGSSNASVLSGNKPLPEPMLT